MYEIVLVNRNKKSFIVQVCKCKRLANNFQMLLSIKFCFEETSELGRINWFGGIVYAFAWSFYKSTLLKVPFEGQQLAGDGVKSRNILRWR